MFVLQVWLFLTVYQFVNLTLTDKHNQPKTYMDLHALGTFSMGPNAVIGLGLPGTFLSGINRILDMR